MPIFAQGPSYQKYTVGTGPTLLYSTRGQAGTAIGTAISVKNPTLFNAGSVTVYILAGGTAQATGGTATAANILLYGIGLLPGNQMTFTGTAVTTTTSYGGVYDMFGCVAGSGTTVVVEGGYATQTLVS
jgi:hypothetical protein